MLFLRAPVTHFPACAPPSTMRISPSERGVSADTQGRVDDFFDLTDPADRVQTFSGNRGSQVCAWKY